MQSCFEISGSFNRAQILVTKITTRWHHYSTTLKTYIVLLGFGFQVARDSKILFSIALDIMRATNS